MQIQTFVLGDIKSNCYVVYEDRRAFMVDPGFDSDQVINFIEHHHLNLEAIYITHGHYDHCGGVRLLKERYLPVVYAPADDTVWFEETPYNRLGHVVPIDHKVNDGDEIKLIGKTFKVIATPGHSAGGTCLYHGDLLFAGDTLFYQSIGRTDLPFADMHTLYGSIKRLYQLLPDETKVLPGHGRPTTIGHEKQYNPFVKG